MIHFVATNVVVDRSDKEYILVGFVGVRDGRYPEALHFQRSYEFDTQDIDLGMDQVYVERNDQSQSGYGGIERVDVSRDRMKVILSGATAESLEDSCFEVALLMTDENFEELKAGLLSVFQGFDILRTEAR